VTFFVTGFAGLALVGNGFAVPRVASLSVLTVLLFAVGLVQPFYNVSGTSIVQSAVPDEQRGTVLSVNNAAMEASFPLPLIGAGYVLAHISPFSLLLVAGVGSLVLWLVTTWLLSGSADMLT
jgi:sugar phosphate permease